MPIPAGIITLWHGAIVDIPAGWVLCDGNNGTPDLSGIFVRGAGGGFDPGDNGGAEQHTHFFTADPHNHTIPAGIQMEAGTGRDNATADSVVTGETNQTSTLPPYYCLAYIMKT